MKFCPKCGALLVLKKKNWVCPKCSYREKGKVEFKTKEVIEGKIKVGVLKTKESDVRPITTITCPKCGNTKAYYEIVQTRAGDEAETRFFTCTKCGYRWREYA